MRKVWRRIPAPWPALQPLAPEMHRHNQFTTTTITKTKLRWLNFPKLSTCTRIWHRQLPGEFSSRSSLTIFHVKVIFCPDHLLLSSCIIKQHVVRMTTLTHRDANVIFAKDPLINKDLKNYAAKKENHIISLSSLSILF